MFQKLVVTAMAAACCVIQLPGQIATAASPPKTVDTWAWCGVHPDDPAAQAGARSMATFSGIDATFGPCRDAPPGYTAAEPGVRYVEPAVYMRLVQINASVGMQTVVYDKRIWDKDPAVRTAAKEFWRPVYEHIAAWDMSDEFNPSLPEWGLLIERTKLVLADVTLDSSIQPYTNHVGDPPVVEKALAEVPGSTRMLSFDLYFADQGVSIAKSLDARVDVLMCAVNTYLHDSFVPSADSIRDDSRRLIAAGCDMILVFGGAQVYGSFKFGPVSIIDRAGEPSEFGSAVLESTGYSNYVPVAPARLLETRADAGASTIDGLSSGIGRRAAGTTTELQVSGRANVRRDAASVVLTVTAINALADGFISVYPCDAPRPNVAQVNHPAGAVVATTVVVKLAISGRVCLFNLAETDLIVDIAGYHPPGTTFAALQPARLLETRSDAGLATVDGRFLGVGARGANSVTQLTVTGRAGVPFGAGTATLSVTVTNAKTAGFVTAFACGQPQPATASVNFSVGTVVTNAVVSGISPDGWVCLYTSADIDLVVDVNGYNPSGASFVAVAPQRALDTRTRPRPVPQSSAVLDPALELRVTGVAGIPASASAAVINLTVTRATKAGFVTVYPCATPRPYASSLNFVAGETVSNMVVAEIGLHGAICLFSSADPDYVIDITAYHP